MTAGHEMVRADHGEPHGALGTVRHQLKLAAGEAEHSAMGRHVEHLVGRVDAQPMDVSNERPARRVVFRG